MSGGSEHHPNPQLYLAINSSPKDEELPSSFKYTAFRSSNFLGRHVNTTDEYLSTVQPAPLSEDIGPSIIRQCGGQLDPIQLNKYKLLKQWCFRTSSH